MRRHAKIVCTLGPATASAAQIRMLVDTGMDVARLNLSHGSRTEHQSAVDAIRAASADSGRAVGILADLQGPKIRLGTFADGPVTLRRGDEFVITTVDVPGNVERCSTTYDGLAADVHTADAILVDDGRVVLAVERSRGTEVLTRVVVGGEISDHKGLNLPGVPVSVPAMSAKDEGDLRWALKAGVDLVALSFVRGPEDVEAVHRIMDEEGGRLPVIAKMEKPQAVDRLAEILQAFDGLMVARGDLGVELPLERVPLVQKRAITMARERSKPVIVATQMLESMISAPRPTRAEASDVANAVLDGADALMLSGETSVGRYPGETVATMDRIIRQVEGEGLDRLPRLPGGRSTIGAAITTAAAITGDTVGAAALVAFTQTGDTVQRLAKHRNVIPMLAFTPDEAVRNRLTLTWGVETFLVPRVRHTDEMVRQVDAALLEINRLARGDLVVIVAGSPPGQAGTTNAMRVHRIGGE
jgi:pyruvate kinase